VLNPLADNLALTEIREIYRGMIRQAPLSAAVVGGFNSRVWHNTHSMALVFPRGCLALACRGIGKGPSRVHALSYDPRLPPSPLTELFEA